MLYEITAGWLYLAVLYSASLLTLCIGPRIVVAISFHQVDCVPNGEARAEGDNEGLENVYCAVEKCHKCFLPPTNGCPATVSVSGSPFKIIGF